MGNCARETLSNRFFTCNSITLIQMAAGQLRPLRHHIYRGAVVGVRGAAVGARGAVVCAPVHVQVLRSTLQNLRHYILGGCDVLVCCFSLQRAKEGRHLLNEVVGGMVMWFRNLAESVVGISKQC